MSLTEGDWNPGWPDDFVKKIDISLAQPIFVKNDKKHSILKKYNQIICSIYFYYNLYVHIFLLRQEVSPWPTIF
jgi:hypothetical protein